MVEGLPDGMLHSLVVGELLVSGWANNLVVDGLPGSWREYPPTHANPSPMVILHTHVKSFPYQSFAQASDMLQ